jgi:hypothetical protein
LNEFKLSGFVIRDSKDQAAKKALQEAKEIMGLSANRRGEKRMLRPE